VLRGAVATVFVQLALVGASASVGASSASHVVLKVSPTDALIDQPVSISLSGLAPRESILLRATTTDAIGNAWHADALFRADASGRVDVAHSRSLSGSYVGRDGMGLLWSMSQVGSTEPRSEQYLDPAVVSKVRFQAIDDRAHLVATAMLTRRWRTSGVTLHRTTLAHDGFIGCYWSPAATSRRMPAILHFGGSEGGLGCGVGLLSSRGYPELDIGYFALPGLPQHLHRIPLEYFEKALRWLARRPGVDPKRIVAWGISRGGEAAFLLGTTYPQLVDAVVDYVGGDTVFGGLDVPGPAWTLHGRGIPAGTAIPIQDIAGPLFMVGGWGDTLFGSGAKVESMATELEAAHKSNFTALTYAGAGHAIGDAVPNLPVGIGVL
jgi:hypothetical protein